MPKCKFYSECKNQQLLWDLHVGIARDAKKPVATGELYAGIAMNVEKSQWLLWDLCAGITTNEECQRFLVTYMRVLKGM